jgi:flagellin
VGLRINQNIAAMNAYRNLTVTDGQMAKSLEKLSSGFRINRAADDAAGLSISEGLRAQVGGTKTAIRNAQDGISVVQTAEGALQEVHSILQRMRDLAVQAANTGSQDNTATAAAQTEINELLSEVNRIGTTTSFGNTKLLDGTFGSGSTTLAGYVRLDADADAVAAGNQAGVNLGAVTNTMFNLAVTTKDATGAFVTSTGTDLTVALPAGTLGYTSASQYQTAIQSAIDTEFGVGNNAYGKIKAAVTDLGDGSWRVAFTNSDGGSITATTATTAANDMLAQIGLVTTNTVAAGTSTGGVFQVGANNSANDRIRVSIGSVSAAQLQVASVNVTTAAGAQSAIDLLDNAIESVSSTRATLGAYQNRFEHTISNLSVAAENLSASESRIRDTDMAAEMVQFTRAQILTQAGTAMLAQANQAPQQVLQLLRG